MAKYSGCIGYAKYEETAPGVYEEVIHERHYYGEVIRYSRQLQNGMSINDNINVSNVISILSDPYAREHIFDMRYITWNCNKWKVSSVDVNYPRLNLTVGGLYNE